MKRENRRRAVGFLGLFSTLSVAPIGVPAAYAQCTVEWTPVGRDGTNGLTGFYGNNSLPTVKVMSEINGSLYVGGGFDFAGDVPANRLARWDGTSWHAVANLAFEDDFGTVDAIAEWNGQIYVGGSFTRAGSDPGRGLIVLDGTTWPDGSQGSIVGDGTIGPTTGVAALAVYNNELYVGGGFTVLNGPPNTDNIVKWNGTAWSEVGGGLNGTIGSMVVYNNTLYVAAVSGFTIDSAGGSAITASGAMWNGSSWTSVPTTGLEAGGTLSKFNFFKEIDGGLYCAAQYTGPNSSRVAQWTGSAWSLLPGSFNANSIRALARFDDGSGSALYATGTFTTAGGVSARRAAKFNGTAWEAAGIGLSSTCTTLTPFSGKLYAGSRITFTDPHIPTINTISSWQCNPTGACCMTNGSCQVTSAYSCSTLGGTYQGDAVACGGCVPAAMGACCLQNGSCVLAVRSGPTGCIYQGGVYRGDNTTCAVGCPPRETEPNDDKLTANAFTVAAGQQIMGLSDTITARDTFRIKTTPAPFGIYRHRMMLTSTTPGHQSGLIGSDQLQPMAGPWPCDLGTIEDLNASVGLQETTTEGANRLSIWYGFGKEEEVYYSVRGLEANPKVTIDPYVSTLETTQVTPTDIGTFPAGSIVFSSLFAAGPFRNIGVVIFDHNLQPIPGSYNGTVTEFTGGGLHDRREFYLDRPYTPGTYYAAVATDWIQTNLGSPCDAIDYGGTTEHHGVNISDFPNVVIVNQFTRNQEYPLDVSFGVADSLGGVAVVPAVVNAQHEVAWFRFTVVRTGCPADFNGDDIRDVADLFAYINAWLAKSTNADFNDDSTVDVSDLFAYINAWLAGC